MQQHTTSYLRSKRKRLLQQLKNIEPMMLRGSLIKSYKKCGKPNCKCISGRGHGPKFYLSVSMPNTRPIMIYIPIKQKQVVEKALANYQKVRQILEKVGAINRELIARKKL